MKIENRVSNKNPNLKIRANVIPELIEKVHEPFRKFFSSSYGSDLSLLLTYLLAYSCTCCPSATALPGGPGSQLTKRSFADHSLLCQVIGLLGSNTFLCLNTSAVNGFGKGLEPLCIYETNPGATS